MVQTNYISQIDVIHTSRIARALIQVQYKVTVKNQEHVNTVSHVVFTILSRELLNLSCIRTLESPSPAFECLVEKTVGIVIAEVIKEIASHLRHFQTGVFHNQSPQQGFKSVLISRRMQAALLAKPSMRSRMKSRVVYFLFPILDFFEREQLKS